MRVFRYVPSAVPMIFASGLLEWLRREFRAVFQGQQNIWDLDITNERPSTETEGMIRYASGAPGWDPGAGRGLYVRTGSAWAKLH